MLNIKTIESKFRRSNIVSSKTFLWSDAPEATKKDVYQTLALPAGEVIILLFYDLGQVKFALTTQAVITMHERIVFNDILNVDFTEIKATPEKKMENSTLDIITRDQSRHILDVEIGTWHIVYSILRFIVNKEGVNSAQR